jgi:hypothetical protein
MNIENRELEGSLLKKYCDNFMKSDPLLGRINVERDIHPGGIRYQEGSKELITEKTQIGAKIEINNDALINYDIANFSEQLANFAFEFLKSMFKSFIQTMEKITAFSGNVTKSQGKDFSWDSIIDGLEKVEIQFDEDGMAKFPELFLSPEVFDKIKQPTPEQEERLEQILQEKKIKYYAKKCSRRLSYID